MKAQGNITIGKTIERHLEAKTLAPFQVVKFYGPNTPERVAGRDVFVTGWRTNRHGGLTVDVRYPVGDTLADSVIDVHAGNKVGVYVDQEDAKADFYA